MVFRLCVWIKFLLSTTDENGAAKPVIHCIHYNEDTMNRKIWVIWFFVGDLVLVSVCVCFFFVGFFIISSVFPTVHQHSVWCACLYNFCHAKTGYRKSIEIMFRPCSLKTSNRKVQLLILVSCVFLSFVVVIVETDHFDLINCIKL